VRIKAIHVTTLLFTLLGLLITWESRKLPYWSEFGPGPGFLPLWLGICLTLLSFSLFIQSMKPKGKVDSEEPFFGGWKESRRVWLVILAYCGLGVLVRWLGFHLLSAFFVLFTMAFVERKSWWASLTAGALTALGFYVIFDVLMKSDLPRGLFWQ
jgi:hypothetical protein